MCGRIIQRQGLPAPRLWPGKMCLKASTPEPFGLRRSHQVKKVLLDGMGNPPGAGALFGFTDVAGQGIYFVDDNENALNLFH